MLYAFLWKVSENGWPELFPFGQKVWRLALKFIPDVLHRVEVMALWRPLKLCPLQVSQSLDLCTGARSHAGWLKYSTIYGEGLTRLPHSQAPGMEVQFQTPPSTLYRIGVEMGCHLHATRVHWNRLQALSCNYCVTLCRKRGTENGWMDIRFNYGLGSVKLYLETYTCIFLQFYINK